MKTSHIYHYHAYFFLEWEMFQILFVEKIKAHISCSLTFYEKRAVYEVKSKNMVEPQAADDNMALAHALCMLDK